MPAREEVRILDPLRNAGPAPDARTFSSSREVSRKGARTLTASLDQGFHGFHTRG